MGFTDYILIVRDYVTYAKTHGIAVGPGRGSGGGSLVNYLIGIADVDPLRFDLLFERFLNPERVSMPDIDDTHQKEDYIARAEYELSVIESIDRKSDVLGKRVDLGDGRTLRKAEGPGRGSGAGRPCN